jgi:FkbM family methyltransferase
MTLARTNRSIPLARNHPILAQFAWRPVAEDGPFVIDGLGGRTRRRCYAGFDWSAARPDGYTLRCVFEPGINEELFEWIDVLESVLRVRHSFTMIELGCGFARWLVIAAVALRQRPPVLTRLIGVEAEPTHYRWALRHLRDNYIASQMVELIRAAVGPADGRATFYTGSADAWYGQALAGEDVRPTARWRRWVRGLRRQPHRPMDTVSHVKMISLSRVLKRYHRVDLLDMDVQGIEGKVIEAAVDAVDHKVEKVHIATHSADVEDGLRMLFKDRGWHNVNDYACGQTNETPFGPMWFTDGVQTWINPRLREVQRSV